MNTTELSIIIPVYNGQEYIGRCLDSVLRQRDVDKYEIIVVNDGSTDNTKKIVTDYANAHKNIHVINQKNGGVSVARNNGIAASHGQYVTFVDCDDMVGLKVDAFDEYFKSITRERKIGNMGTKRAYDFPTQFQSKHFSDTYFTNMLQAAKINDADVVFGGKITINLTESYSIRQVYDTTALYGQEQQDKKTVMQIADSRESANFALYSREMLDSHNLRFLANMKLDEDILFCMLAALYANKVATVKDVTYFYNRHEYTLSNMNHYEMKRKYKLADIQRFSYLLNELGKMPQYPELFRHWLGEYAIKGEKYTYDSGDFPSKACGNKCDAENCNECFIADALREQFKENIKKYLDIKKKHPHH